MQVIVFPPEPALVVMQTINNRFAPCTIYVLGYNSITTTVNDGLGNRNETANHHFTLLVFSAKATPGTATNIANTIAEQSGKTITATVLLHKVTDLATKQPNQQRFFDGVLRYGHRLCLDKTTPPYLHANTIPPQDREGDTAFWLKGIAVAQFNIQAAKESPQLEVELCKIALLNTACTQIALGLIRVCMSYTPNEFGLKYLLQLCQYACHNNERGNQNPLPSAFNPKTMRDKYRFNCLCAPPSMLNHKLHLNTSEEDFLFILDATQQFLDQASNHITCHSREDGNPKP